MKKFIFATLTLLAISSTATAQFDGLSYEQLQELEFERNAVNQYQQPSGNDGGSFADPSRPSYGNSSMQPFSRIETDFRGQKWKITGYRGYINGEFREYTEGRVALRNGVQFDTGKQTKITPHFDANGNLVFHKDTKSTKILDSASDRLRNHVDGGRKQWVDRTERDPRTGELYRVKGYVWTSFGKPHADLTRTRIRQDFNGNIETESETIVAAPAPTP